MEDANRDIEERIRNLCDRTSGSMDRRIMNDLAGKLKKCEPFKPMSRSAGIWRMTRISRRFKIAAAAVVALAVLLPVSYAAVEAVVKYFTISEDEVSFEVQDANGALGFAAHRSISVGGTNIATEEEARARLEEFRRLYREGKAKEIQPGLWQVTLSNGELFNYRGDPQQVTAEFTPKEEEQMREEFEEINALQRAGKGERTFLREETQQNGAKVRVYEARYTLASGKIVTRTEAEGFISPRDAGDPVEAHYGEADQAVGGSVSGEMGFHEGP